MSQFRPLSATMFVSPQIDPADIAEAKAQGITLVINNRPDGEEAGQVPGAEIEAATKTLGLDYIAIPIAGTFDAASVDAMRSALADHAGKALAYCRSGTRSAHLWALAQARDGVPLDTIKDAGAEAGYDLARVDALLTQLG